MKEAAKGMLWIILLTGAVAMAIAGVVAGLIYWWIGIELG